MTIGSSGYGEICSRVTGEYLRIGGTGAIASPTLVGEETQAAADPPDPAVKRTSRPSATKRSRGVSARSVLQTTEAFAAGYASMITSADPAIV